MSGNDPGPEGKGSNAYHLNLVLLVVLVVLLTIWIHLHVYQYVAQAFLVGGTLSLWGLWKIVQSLIKKGGVEFKLSTVIENPAVREFLVFGILVTLVLYATTSSIYVEFEGAGRGETQFKVDVLHNGNPYVETLDVTSYDRVAGRPFFLRLAFLDLRIEVVEPRGYRPVSRKLKPWSSLRLRVPSDFDRKRYHVIRLVPGAAFFNQLPRAEDEPSVFYYLEIRAAEDRFAVDDLRRGSVYIGAAEEDLKWLVADFGLEESTRRIADHFATFAPREQATEFAIYYETHRTLKATSEFDPGDSLTVVLGRVGDQEPLLRQSVIVSDTAGIQTVFLKEE